MVYLLKIVIFHGYVTNNQRVYPVKCFVYHLRSKNHLSQSFAMPEGRQFRRAASDGQWPLEHPVAARDGLQNAQFQHGSLINPLVPAATRRYAKWWVGGLSGRLLPAFFLPLKSIESLGYESDSRQKDIKPCPWNIKTKEHLPGAAMSLWICWGTRYSGLGTNEHSENTPLDVSKERFHPKIAGWWLSHPSEKYESQLGSWHSQYMEKYKLMFQTSNQK